MNLDQLLARVEEMANEATAGPYHSHVSDSYGVWWQVEAPPCGDLKDLLGGYHPVARNMRSGDAEMLAASRSLILPLVAVARAAQEFHRLTAFAPDSHGDNREKLGKALAELAEVRIE